VIESKSCNDNNRFPSAEGLEELLNLLKAFSGDLPDEAQQSVQDLVDELDDNIGKLNRKTLEVCYLL
jgi:hypothetical protein